GLDLGDVHTGLIIWSRLQLMTLGVATYGGAAVPDFLSGAIMGTAYAIISGKGAEYGIGVAVPIGVLLTQLDILGRMANTLFQP
ncbi:PTS sugar transporter subunit IIC, partial [Enterococcus faecalis]|uniref:PTS sugar transporter subunit IIC n=1 Tax=Enterococcus faecalis TaxID=1351 RepID=UPI0021E0FA2E